MHPKRIGTRAALSWPTLLLSAAVVFSPASVNAADPPVPAAFGPIHPRLSPDGRTVAFAWQGSIGVLTVAGGPLRVLTTNEGFDGVPAWSPDGTRLAHVRSSGTGPGQLQLIEAESGRMLPLPSAIRAEGPFFFHPDGRRILGRFSASGAPGPLSWYDIESGAISAAPTRAQTSSGSYATFCLTLDGRWIVYAEHRDRAGEQGGNQGPYTELWRIQTQTDAASPTPERLATWPARIYTLAGDADGGGVFAVTDRGTAHNDVWHLPFTNLLVNAEKVTSGQADEDWPSVSRDGRLLIHTDNRGGLTQLVVREPGRDTFRTLVPDTISRPEPSANLQIELRDSIHNPLTARISLKREGGKYHSALGAIYRTLGGYGFFYARDTAELSVPAGTYELTVLRGPEYRPYRAKFQLEPGSTTRHTATLERWTDAASRGWYSGENHVHANYGYGPWYITPRALLQQCEGEDLNVCNAVVANSDGDAVLDREFFLGAPDPRSMPGTILYWNEEFRSTIWGHLTLGRLSQLVEPVFTGFLDTTNPYDIPTNGDIAERTRAQRGTVSYTHPASNPEDLYDRPYTAKGLPVDAALGRIDTMDVAGSSYPASILLWYRLLNCGFRIPAAAGTDCFLNRLGSYPPGWARAYVKLPGGLDYSAWHDAQSRGQSFVTDGPMLEFQVDALEPGGTNRLTAPGKVRVRGSVESQYPLDRLELVRDGRVTATGELTPERFRGTLDVEVSVSESGWVALRASGPPPPYLAVGQLWAHSNPVYLEVAGRPYDASDDAAYFLKWIDRLDADLKSRNRAPTGPWQIQAQLDAARSVYRKLSSSR